MLEFFSAAFQPMNLVLTILMILVVIYWITVILGVLDFDFLDFDLDAGDADLDMSIDVDVDIDIDADIDADVDGGGPGGKGLLGFISWFNVGKIPFMIVMTVVVFSMWMGSILTNHYVGNTSLLISLLLYIPLFFLSLIVTKVVTTPLVPLFDKLNFNGEKQIDLEGKTGILMLGVNGKSIGQAKLFVQDKNFLIYVVSFNGTPIKQGKKIVVVEKKEKFYLVEKVDD